MEMLGRALLDDEIVHHKDGDKTNNARENLEVRIPEPGTLQGGSPLRLAAAIPPSGRLTCRI